MNSKEEIDKILGSVATKRFSNQLLRETLSELLGQQVQGSGLLFVEEVTIDIIDHVSYCYMIFKDLSCGKFYRVKYRFSTDEDNPMVPFDNDPGMVECTEIQLVKVEVEEWCEVRK